MTLMEDNQGAIANIKGDIASKRSKHANINYHFMKELIDAESLSVKYVPTHDNIADLFTKPLGRIAFTNLRCKVVQTRGSIEQVRQAPEVRRAPEAKLARRVKWMDLDEAEAAVAV